MQKYPYNKKCKLDKGGQLMKQALKNKVGTIRNKILDLIDDLNDRLDTLQERDDIEGIWQEEMDEIEQLINLLDQTECDLSDYE